MSEINRELIIEEQKPELTPAPKIVDIISSGASALDIADEMSAEMDGGSPDAEKVYIGLNAIRRNEDRRKALFRLSSRNDKLGKLAQRVLKDDELSTFDIEEQLGLSRFGEKAPDPNIYLKHKDEFEKVYQYGMSKGYIKPEMGLEECHKNATGGFANDDEKPPHLSGAIENEIFNMHMTFGAYEPSYAEIIGPEEIFRLRKQANPRFLLLGSLGVYSSRDFEQFAAKISSKISTFVIDKNSKHARIVKNDPVNPERMLVQGDAGRMPFADRSIDHVYTNHLFHSVSGDPFQFQDKVDEIIEESSRVLKPGGSLIIVEQPYGLHRIFPDQNMFEHQVDSSAAANFQEGRGVYPSLSFTFRQENGTTVINKNGLAIFRDKLIQFEEETLVRRYIKK